MKRFFYFAIMAMCLTFAAQAQDVNKPTVISSDFCYGIYGGVGGTFNTGSLSKNFGSSIGFQLGLTAGYDNFRLKTEVQFSQPGYKNNNIFNKPVEEHGEQVCPSQVNSNSNATLLGWGIQVGYLVYEKDRLSITPNVGVLYTNYRWNLDNLTWTKKEGEEKYTATVASTEKARLSNVGVMASVDFDYRLKTKITDALGGNKRFTSSIRVTPWVSYQKYNKCDPSVKGCMVGITVNYLGLLRSLNF